MMQNLFGFLLAAVVCIAGMPAATHATTIAVTTTDDEINADGDCSLREAIKAANTNAAVDACAAGQSDQVDTITVPAGTYTLALAGNDDNDAVGDLDIRDDVTITGAGAAATIIQACDVAQQTATCPAGHGIVDRVFEIIDAEATITGVTVRHGRAGGNPGHGVFVRQFNDFNVVPVSLTLTDAVVTKNGMPDTNTTRGGGLAVQNATATLTRVTVSDNVLGSPLNGGLGGGISLLGNYGNNANPASLGMTDCTVSGNTSGNGGGGIHADHGSAIVTSTTISGNHTGGSGGGFATSLGCSGTLTNCTISGNQADGSFGGGLFLLGGAGPFNVRSCTITLNHNGPNGQGAGGLESEGGVVLRNTIIAGNISDNPGPSFHSPDCQEIAQDAIVSEGHDILGEALHCPSLADGQDHDRIGTQAAPIDPKLGPLADNGGPTLTHALIEGSPALDTADPAAPGSGGTACPATDQRGETRPAGAACDVGAFEGGSSGALAVGSVEPTRGGTAGTVQARIYGTGFVAGTAVKLVRAGFSDVDGAPAAVRGGVVTTSFDLRGVPPGPWSVVVTNPDQSTGTLPDAFTVETGGSPDLWVNLLLPRGFSGGYYQSIYVVFGNRGTVDAYGVPLWLAFSNELTFHIPFAVTPPPAQPAQIATDWKRIGIDVTIPPPEDRNSFPLLLPVVPAGSTGMLKFRVQNPAADVGGRPVFRVSVDIGAPHFDPDLTDAVVNGYVDRAKEYAATAHGTTTLPTDAAIASYVRTQLAGVRATATEDAIAAVGGYPRVYSQAQLIVDTGQFIAGESATTLAPALGPSLDRHWLARVVSEIFASPAEARLVDPDCDPLDTFCERYPSCETNPNLCKDPPIRRCDRISFYNGSFVFVPCKPQDDDRPFRMAFDPNDKVGPGGPIDGVTPLPYAVYFENLPTATGDAFTVTVTDQLDTAKYDLSTFSLGPITFGSTFVPVPPGLKTLATEVDLRPGKKILVGIDAKLDTGTGVVTWKLTTLDPATHQFPENPEDGFLPPNVTSPQGEGALLFTVNLKPGFPPGTTVCNDARIIFDMNAPIDTPEFCNTIAAPAQPETDCGNCVDDDGNGLTDFEDPSCCSDSGPTLNVRRGLMKPAKNNASRLLLQGALAGTLPDATASGLAIQLRSSDGGELLCARIAANKLRRKGKAVRFADAKGKVAGAGGLASVLLKSRKGGSAALTIAAKKATLTTPAAGPVAITLGFGDGTAPGQCAAATPTFRAKKGNAIVVP